MRTPQRCPRARRRAARSVTVNAALSVTANAALSVAVNAALSVAVNRAVWKFLSGARQRAR